MSMKFIVICVAILGLAIVANLPLVTRSKFRSLGLLAYITCILGISFFVDDKTSEIAKINQFFNDRVFFLTMAAAVFFVIYLIVNLRHIEISLSFGGVSISSKSIEMLRKKAEIRKNLEVSLSNFISQRHNPTESIQWNCVELLSRAFGSEFSESHGKVEIDVFNGNQTITVYSRHKMDVEDILAAKYIMLQYLNII